MKKLILMLALLVVILPLNSQIYTAKDGATNISFFSKAPLEDIEAANKGAMIVLRASTSDLQIRISIQNFKFKNALMEEHFNENYMESEKFPNCEFKGKINETVDYNKDGDYKVSATGKLTLHGVTKDVTINGSMTVAGKEIKMDAAKFKIKVADYNIKVPSMYVKNIAEEVEITFNTTLEPFQKK